VAERKFKPALRRIRKIANSVSLVPACIARQGGECRRHRCDQSLPHESGKVSQNYPAPHPNSAGHTCDLYCLSLCISRYTQEKSAHSWNLLRITRGDAVVNESILLSKENISPAALWVRFLEVSVRFRVYDGTNKPSEASPCEGKSSASIPKHEPLSPRPTCFFCCQSRVSRCFCLLPSSSLAANCGTTASRSSHLQDYPDSGTGSVHSRDRSLTGWQLYSVERQRFRRRH
jgi:hypothetical protein